MHPFKAHLELLSQDLSDELGLDRNSVRRLQPLLNQRDIPNVFSFVDHILSRSLDLS